MEVTIPMMSQQIIKLKTYEGTYYYPQAEINILVGLDFKF